MAEPLGAQALDQLFRTARTHNDYRDVPVAPEQLEAIWELMKFGPTSANCLPARIIWCTSAAAKNKLADCALANNAPKIRKAPVAVIIGMDMAFYDNLPEFFPHIDAKSWFVGNDALIAATALRNSSLQGGYLIMAARALGLDTGPMSGFDNAAVDAAFFADQPMVKSNFIATLGYGDSATVYARGPRPAFGRFNRIV